MLPRSIFATKGARAMGDAGRMPVDHKEVAGLQIAYVARDALTAHLRCPVFGRITTLNRKRGGGKPERGAALVHNIFHVPERPDIMALAITWLIGRDELPKYYPFPQFPQGDPEFTGKAYKAMAPHECILDTTWRELSAFSTFEPSIKVFRSTSAESYEMYQNDPDVIILTGVIREIPYKNRTFKRLELLKDVVGLEWDILDLLEKCFPDDAIECSPPAIEPPPPSGLVPFVPSFESIEQDVMYINGCVYRIGVSPDGPAHAVEYVTPEGKFRYGVLLRRTEQLEAVLVRELLTAQQLEERIEEVNAPRVHEAWTLAPYDLVLTAREHEVPRTQVIRPITCLRDRAYFAGHLDGRSGVRGLNIMLDETHELRAIKEPLTEAMVNKQIHILRNELNPNDRENIASLLRNEVRFQAVPEKIKNLQCARIEFPMEYATFLQVPYALEADPVGDRELTVEYFLKDESEMRALWGGALPNGWVVPEKQPDRAGRKRERLASQKGYMVIMMHNDRDGKGVNKFSYTRETKKFILTLALAFFSENLNFVTGEQPPPAPEGWSSTEAAYDIVSMSWVQRANAPAWTTARARDHFGEC